MDCFDSPEQAAEYATLAFTQMRWLKIAPTPRNYCVWYEYASGRNPALRAGSPAPAEVEAAGMRIAAEGERVGL